MMTAVIGRARRAREDGAHSHERVGAGVDADAGERVGGDLAESRAEHRAEEQGRGEYASRAADRDRERRGNHLADEEQDEEADDVLAHDGVLEHRIADAVHLGEAEQQQAEQEAANGGAKPLGALPQAVGDVLEAVEHLDEAGGDDRREQAEHRVERVLAQRVDGERRQAEERDVAEGRAADHGGRHRGEHDGGEGAGDEVGEKQFEGEEHPRDGRVEGGRDAARGAARDEESHLRLVEFGPPRDRGAHRGADLDDRPLAADRTARADRDGRGECLDERHPAREFARRAC